MNFKVALFDLDGTLIDSEKQYTLFWGKMGHRYLPDIPDFASRIKGTTLKSILTYFDEDKRDEVTKAINDYEYEMEYPFVAGADAFVKDLRQHGVKCGIVTSSDKTKMGVLSKKQGAFLEMFDKILTAEDFTASKPDPDCYIKGAESFGVEQKDCVVFEDALNGLAAGMASGSFTIGLATGNPRDVIEPLCDYVLDDFRGVDYNKIMEILQG